VPPCRDRLRGARPRRTVASRAFRFASRRGVQTDIDNRQLGFRLITYMLLCCDSCQQVQQAAEAP
jgi:hypothetical protein